MDYSDRWPTLRQIIAVAAILGLWGCDHSRPELEVPSSPQSVVSPDGQLAVTDLGTLGGPISGARGINDLGEVVGSSETTPWGQGGTGGGFIWTPADGMADIGQLPGMGFVSAAAINDLGQVVGSDESHAFLWTPGEGMQDLGNLGRSTTAPSDVEASAYAHDINNRGQVVGSSYKGPHSTRAFLWTQKDGMRDLGTLGGLRSMAFAINDLGQVVGRSETTENATHTHAFLWTSTGGMRDLGTLGGPSSGASDLNNLGEIVGTSSPASGTKRAFLWTQGNGMEELDPAARSAVGINDLGQVVGSLRHHAGGAFLWTPQGGLAKLPHLTRSVGSAGSINNRGQIVGKSAANRDPVSIMHAVLWTLPLDQAPPDEAIAAVEAEVDRLFAEAPGRREAQVLATKLNAASWQLNRGNVRGASLVLEALIVYVQSAQRLGSLTAEEAEQLEGGLRQAAERAAAKQHR